MEAIELLTVRVPPEVKRWLESESECQGMSISRLVVAAIMESDDYHSHSTMPEQESEHAGEKTEQKNTIEIEDLLVFFHLPYIGTLGLALVVLAQVYAKKMKDGSQFVRYCELHLGADTLTIETMLAILVQRGILAKEVVEPGTEVYRVLPIPIVISS